VLNSDAEPVTAADSLLDELFVDDSVTFLPDDPVAWIEREFYVPETMQAIVLEPYQRAVLREAFRRDDDGQFIYSLVLWGDLKKSAKSTIAAAAVLWLAWHREWESARIVGNDLKQADSRTFFYIRRAIELNPRLKAVCTVKNYHIALPNHTTIEAIAVDPKGEAGGGDLIVCFTELWAAKNEAAKQLWTETTLSPLKYGRSLRWCESYAGYIGASPILEQLYEQGVTGGRVVDVKDDEGRSIEGLELYANDSARLLALWNTQPRCSWQTEEYYGQEAATLTPSEFQRVHRNRWAASEEAFVPDEWWQACKGDVPPLPPYKSVVVGIDAATDSDCFAIVTVFRIGEPVYVLHARQWTPPKGGKLVFNNPDNPNDETTPEGYLRWLARTYPVVEFCYDPYQLHDLASRLRREGVGHFYEFTQGALRLVADKQLYDLIRDRAMVHPGHLHDLNAHIANANRKAEGDKLRIVKRKPELKIDLAVATSMAAHEAKRLNIG
jgi:phage terminase large subunit-like protein